MEHVVAIFGASGRTGRKVVAAVIARGWTARVLVRKTCAFIGESPKLSVHYGTLDDAQAIRAVVASSDAVCCVFGPRSPYTEIFCAHGMELILDAMRSEGVRRLICQTGAMVGERLKNRTIWFEHLARAFEQRQPEAAEDRRRQEAVVRASETDWTIVKPPRLTDGKRTGRAWIGTDLRVGLLSKISRSDLAEVIVDEIDRPRHQSEAVFVLG